ncbi:MAG TPA: hypothetical protein VMV68_04770, partial [Spirochaetia bacterium]|nr:hypothetical protein [Spirochaetia bacterium]
MSTIQQGSFASGSIYRILQWLFLIVAILIVIVTATVGYNAGSRYYWGFTLLILPIVGYLLARRGGRALDLRRKVQFRWARPRPVDEERDSSACRSYFASLGRMEGEVVDDRTWEDLSMDRIVDDMDVCFSLAGRNELYLLLRRCLPSAEEQAGFSRLTDRIRTDEPFRLELLSQLAVLANGSDKDSSELLSSERLVVDPLLPLYITMSAAVFVSFAMPFLLGVGTGLLLIIGVFLTNMWIYYRKSRHITDLVPMLRGLFRLIRQAG